MASLLWFLFIALVAAVWTFCFGVRAVALIWPQDQLLAVAVAWAFIHLIWRWVRSIDL